jgi:four helix bundle protein
MNGPNEPKEPEGPEDAEVSFRKYLVWKRAHKLAIDVYHATALFPKEETYGLMSQLRRAAFSVPANFVEGYARGAPKEFMRHLNIAFGSLSELEYGIQFSKDIGYLAENDYHGLDALRSETAFLMTRFMESIKSKIS